MIHSVAWLSLLAQRSKWERLGDRFRGDYAKLDTADLLLIVGAGLLLVLVVILLQRVVTGSPARFASNSPRALFRELCRAHRLGRSQRWLLKRLAALRKLHNPSVLFVEPTWLDPKQLPSELAKHAGELEKLRGQLYAPPNEAVKRSTA